MKKQTFLAVKKTIAVNLVISLVSLSLAFAALELATRLHDSQPVFSIKNFRGDVRDLYKEGLPAQFDASLGWIPKIGYSGKNNKWGTQVTILADGVRSNGDKNRDIETPSVVAVGDSFTFGDQVSDAETWPAVLQDLLGKQVINGGVFAYGVDQSYLRLQQLLPIYRPSTVIFSFIPDDFYRCQYSVSVGANKPFFRVQDDTLKLMNTPVEQAGDHEFAPFANTLLGHSLLAHKVMMKVNPIWWLNGRSWSEHPTGESGGKIACLIFQDLKDIAKKHNVNRTYLLFQQHGPRETPPEKLAMVNDALKCIDPEVITVIDLPSHLSKVKQSDPKRYDSFFSGHMTHAGNSFVAETIAEVFRADKR